jgi:Leucine-rich repeat (LRR) protein
VDPGLKSFLEEFSVLDYLMNPVPVRELLKPLKNLFTGRLIKWDQHDFNKSERERSFQKIVLSGIINKRLWQTLMSNHVNIFVKEICLENCKATFFENLDFLSNFKMLEKLKIKNVRSDYSSNRVSQLKVSHLLKLLAVGSKGSSSLRNLSDLNFSGHSLAFSEGLAHCEKFGADHQFGDSGRRLGLLTKLKRLKLRYNDLGSAESCRIFEEPLLSGLESLDLSKNKIQVPISDDWGCSLKNLLLLNLSENNLKCQGCQKILSCDLLPNLTTLNLSENRIINPLPSERCQLINLKQLILSRNWIESSGSQLLFSCNDLSKLEDLDLSQNKIELPIFADEVWLVNLMKLDLNRNHITHEGSKLIFACKKFFRLQNLNLSHNTIDVPIKKFFLKNLEKLDLSFNKINNVGSFSIFSQEMEYLSFLNISHNMIFSPVDDKFKLRGLKILNLSHNIIFDAGAQNFFARLTNLELLRVIDLSVNKIIIPVAQGIPLNSLEKLNLSFNEINSQGSQQLLASSSFSKIKELNLTANQIKEPLSGEFAMKTLERLLIGSNQLSPKGAGDLLYRQGKFYGLKWRHNILIF